MGRRAERMGADEGTGDSGELGSDDRHGRTGSLPLRPVRPRRRSVHMARRHAVQLLHEEFGDGIMSAIDFKMDIRREPDPKGDRVNIVLSGKFLPYKQY